MGRTSLFHCTEAEDQRTQGLGLQVPESLTYLSYDSQMMQRHLCDVSRLRQLIGTRFDTRLPGALLKDEVRIDSGYCAESGKNKAWVELFQDIIHDLKNKVTCSALLKHQENYLEFTIVNEATGSDLIFKHDQ
jgi:hypothetical protein